MYHIYIYIMLDADESWDFQLSWLLTWEDGNGTSRDWHFPKGEDLLQIFAGCWVVMRGVAPIIWDSRTFEDPDNRPYFWNIYIYININSLETECCSCSLLFRTSSIAAIPGRGTWWTRTTTPGSSTCHVRQICQVHVYHHFRISVMDADGMGVGRL